MNMPVQIQMQDFDKKLAAAINIDVPENLESEISANIRLEDKLSAALKLTVPKNLEADILTNIKLEQKLSQAFEVEVPIDLEANILANIKLEQKLSQAFDVEVPSDMQARVLTAQRISEADATNVHMLKPRANKAVQEVLREDSVSAPKHSSFNWMSIAAGVVLAIGLSITTYKLGQNSTFEQQVFAHINEDIHTLERDNNVRLASFNRMYASHGIRATENIGNIRYAGNCLVGGKLVPHFVLDFNGYAMTVAYIPGETSSEHTLGNERFDGLVFGGSRGSFMIVSEERAPLEDMQKHIQNTMHEVEI